jgi:hypothetical protein
MTVVFVVIVVVVIVGLIGFALVRFGGEPLHNLGLNPEQRAYERMTADAEDMVQMLELANRERRAAGQPELTEDDLRYGSSEH